jgi:uncharacterized SAM-binding protein YcdF (DUF218 family)
MVIAPTHDILVVEVLGERFLLLLLLLSWYSVMKLIKIIFGILFFLLQIYVTVYMSESHVISYERKKKKLNNKF